MRLLRLQITNNAMVLTVNDLNCLLRNALVGLRQRISVLCTTRHAVKVEHYSVTACAGNMRASSMNLNCLYDDRK